MKSRQLARQLQRLENLIERTQAASKDDLELQAHWGRYLCVLVAGFLENALTEVYSDFARRSASPRPARYIGRVLSRVQNPKAGRFVETAGSFDAGWGASLQAFLDEDGRKEAIDGIMSNRNSIAHGRDTRITAAQVSEYLKKCVVVVEYLESQSRR